MYQYKKMTKENRNDLQNILTQNLNELKDELGEKFNINKVNLAELERRTGISRGKLRALKANGFIVKPHGLAGKTSNNNVIEAFSGVLEDLLSRGVSNASACYDRICEVSYAGSKSAVKNYIKNHKYLIPAKRQLVSPQGNRGRRYETGPGESYQMDWGFVTVDTENEKSYKIACFAMICHHCGQRYIEFFPNAKQENLFIGMLHAFMYMGVPKYVLTDNMKSVVIRRDYNNKPVWQKDYELFMGNIGFDTKLCKPRHPFTKRDRYGGADWVETQKAVLQEMMLKEFGWERFYKDSNPRGNLTLSDYRREKAAEMAKEEERKLEDIKDKVTAGQATIQAQAEQMEAILESLDKGAEAERQLSVRITDKNAELNDVMQNLADKSTELDELKQDLTDKKSEVWEQEQKLTLIKEDADETIHKARFAEELIDYFKNTNSREREKAYFEKMLDLKYENECLKQENQELKFENRTLKEKLNKVYDFMRQFTINGMNMLEHFLRSIGGWVQQKVAGMSR